jgi:hypothetical protein
MQAFTAGLIAQNFIEAMAVQAEIEGMKATNAECSIRGEPPAYSEEAFQDKAGSLYVLANLAREAGMRE